jgi:two-component system sensor histidine kinase RegB
VRLAIRQKDGFVGIAVEDSGTGMAADTLQRAGEPFFTTKPPGSGFGLGLFLARTFAERWGGTVALTSSPGQGTTATLLLPARLEDANHDRRSNAPAPR